MNAAPQIYLDANIFLRFLTDDHPRMAAECRELFTRAEAGELQLHTSHLVLAELAWTLRSHYEVPRAQVAEMLQDILSLRSLRVEQKEMLRAAVALFGQNNVDFIDAYHAVDLQRRGFESICSYDKDFDRLGIVRIEPAQV